MQGSIRKHLKAGGAGSSTLNKIPEEIQLEIPSSGDEQKPKY